MQIWQLNFLYFPNLSNGDAYSRWRLSTLVSLFNNFMQPAFQYSLTRESSTFQVPIGCHEGAKGYFCERIKKAQAPVLRKGWPTHCWWALRHGPDREEQRIRVLFSQLPSGPRSSWRVSGQQRASLVESVCTISLRIDTNFSLVYRVTSTYMFPFKEDLCRFDFEVAPEDEYMCDFGTMVAKANGITNGISNWLNCKRGCQGCFLSNL